MNTLEECTNCPSRPGPSHLVDDVDIHHLSLQSIPKSIYERNWRKESKMRFRRSRIRNKQLTEWLRFTRRLLFVISFASLVSMVNSTLEVLIGLQTDNSRFPETMRIFNNALDVVNKMPNAQAILKSVSDERQRERECRSCLIISSRFIHLDYQTKS